MIERLLDIVNYLTFDNGALSDKGKECAVRFYGYICAGADKSSALNYYASRADSGDFVAHYIAGLCYYLAFDFANARKYFEAICAKSDSHSTFRHIDGGEFGIDSKDLQKIKARCYRYIGVMHKYGRSVEIDYAKAVECYQKSADFGDAWAHCNLGYMYHKGEGVAQDYGKAIECYQKACDLGNGRAYYNLGIMYENGNGVVQSYQKAFECYQKGADLGDTSAFVNLGNMYANGRSVAQDYSKAVELYQKGANLGDAVAHYNLGVMYNNGYGVAQDFSKAAKLYQKACELGHSGAHFNLGLMYHEDGANWHCKKEVVAYEDCDLCDANACCNIGVMYSKGYGVAQDKHKALQLYKKACDLGNKKGCENYKILKDKIVLDC